MPASFDDHDCQLAFDASAPRARDILLKLLVSKQQHLLDSATAIRACGLFDISPNNTRVALNRLHSAGLIERGPSAGTWQFGAAGLALGREVSRWRTVAQGLRPWDGAWLVVVNATRAKPERKTVRHGQRALDLLGFRQLDLGLHIRPDNFVDGVDGVRQRLLALGLDAQSHVLQARELDATREVQARSLWDVAAITQAYARTQSQLQASLARLPLLPLEQAARECWLEGDRGIRQIIFDPLLPEPLVSATARQAFVEAVIGYDEAGKRIWHALLS